jgi:ATP-dependent RNA helicase DDX42
MYMVGITETAASEARETAKKEVVNQYDDDDPLDAYMKSLSSTTPKSSSGGRLDMDADEEATSHWHEHTAGNNSSMPRETEASLNEDCANTQSFAHSLEGMAAKSALAESFQMSGTYKKKIVEHDDETGLKRKHQEITPLERLDHTGIAYEPFCKIFLTSPQNTEIGIRWRQEETVTCQPSQWDPMTTFEDLNGVFPQELLEAISSAKFETPTPVQSQTLPVTLAGRDVLVTASTGSGKTLAFVWPMVVHCNDQPHIDPKVNAGPIGLILTPTRELAQQVYKHVKKMVRSIGGTAVAVTGGGKGRYELVKELQKGCEIVVATPGRLIDVLGNKSHLSLRRVTMLVLDEADKMLDMGFESQVSSIMDNVRPDRQTLLFSATFGKKVERVARNWLQNPVRYVYCTRILNGCIFGKCKNDEFCPPRKKPTMFLTSRLGR